MDVQITTLGALLGLVVAIILIIKKVHPAYSLILGAVVGGLVGGAGLTGTVDVMMSGAKDIMPAILRIITSGVLAGVLIRRKKSIICISFINNDINSSWSFRRCCCNNSCTNSTCNS